MEPPGPVPNPEVKHFSADGSWAIGPVRVGRRQVICPLLANAGSGLFCARIADKAQLNWRKKWALIELSEKEWPATCRRSEGRMSLLAKSGDFGK